VTIGRVLVQRELEFLDYRVSESDSVLPKKSGHPARKVYRFSETSKGELGMSDCMIH